MVRGAPLAATNKSHKKKEKKNIETGWAWQTDWQVVTGPHTDAEGWVYSVDFRMTRKPNRCPVAACASDLLTAGTRAHVLCSLMPKC